MKVLAIDPGYERCGVAVLEHAHGEKGRLLYSACVRTDAALPFPERLGIIGNEVEALITKWSPTDFAMESLLFNTNQKTAMHVAEVRGMLLYLAQTHELHISEYTPPQIKAAVGAGGRASKRDVIGMIHMLLDMSKTNTTSTIKKLDDEYDAIAVGLTHSAMHR